MKRAPAAAPATTRTLVAVGLALLAAGCGSAGSSYSGSGTPAVVSAPPPGAPVSIRLHVGQLLSIPVIGLEEAQASPAGVLTAVNSGNGVTDFRAVASGATTVTVTEAAACSPGVACSHLVLRVGTYEVTVTG
jgi:hypothetical protein